MKDVKKFEMGQIILILLNSIDTKEVRRRKWMRRRRRTLVMVKENERGMSNGMKGLS